MARKGRTTEQSGTESAISRVLAETEKRTGSSMTMRKATAIPRVTHIETGCFLQDLATLGGIPDGLYTMLYGWESSGKTTTAIKTIAAAQRKYPDRMVAYIDMEHKLDLHWMQSQGVDMDRVYIVSPQRGEEAVDIGEALLKTGELCMLVLDSLPALTPSDFIDSSAEDQKMASSARLIGRMCNVWLAATRECASKHGWSPTVILINQFRSKVGVTFGDPRTLPGGHQPNYISALRMETKKIKDITAKDEDGIDVITHAEHGFHIKKNTLGASIQDGEYTLVKHPAYGLPTGTVAQGRTIVTYANKVGLLSGGGGAYRLDGVDEPFRTYDAIATFLDTNEDHSVRIQRAIIAMKRQQVGLPAIPHDGYLLGYV